MRQQIKVLIEAWKNPDSLYRSAGAVVWMYAPPCFYWVDPKDCNIKKDGQVLAKKEEMIAKKMDITDWIKGGATHGQLIRALKFTGKSVPSGPYSKIAFGRSLKKDHRVHPSVKTDLIGVEKKQREALETKAIETAKRHLK